MNSGTMMKTDKEREEMICHWKLDNFYGGFSTECEKEFPPDFDPEQAEFVFCPYCGKKMKLDTENLK